MRVVFWSLFCVGAYVSVCVGMYGGCGRDEPGYICTLYVS